LHVLFAGQEPDRDLARREAAQDLQRQHELALQWNGFIDADEQHAQLVVGDLVAEACVGGLHGHVGGQRLGH
jgi:hypothetical protein